MSTKLEQMSREFMRNRHNLSAFIGSLVPDPAAVEDLFQEVWLRLARAGAENQSIDNVPAWCRGVARNLILHYWRDQKRDTVVVDSELVQLAERAFVECPVEAADWRERKMALQGCIQKLPSRMGKVVQMHYSAGRSVREIAEAMGRSLSAAKMTLMRARQELQNCVDRKLGENAS